MKRRILYQCEYCSTEYENHSAAFRCEAQCLGLTQDAYIKYLDLLAEENDAGIAVYICKNDKTEKRFDDAIRNVIAFQKKHGIEMTR